MSHPLTQDSVWYNKFRFDDAEKQHHEKSSSSQTVNDVIKPSGGGCDSEMVGRLQRIEQENQELKKVTQDLKSLILKLQSRVNSIEEQTTKTPGKQVQIVKEKETKSSKEEDDDDDDIDLFGSDDENEESSKVRKERLQKYAEKKAKKPGVIAKSNVIFDVKPWDDETDMKKMEELVRKVQMDGLLWGVSKLVEIGYGIKKLQISSVIEDDKISVDLIEEKITEYSDFVQSVDIAAFNKI